MQTPKRVLVVEDEPVLAMLMEDLLQSFGCEAVACAGVAHDATRLANDLDVDFALLDINIQGGDSFEAADALKRRGVPFAFVTGYGVQGVRPDLRDTPITHKPLEVGALRAVIAELTA